MTKYFYVINDEKSKLYNSLGECSSTAWSYCDQDTENLTFYSFEPYKPFISAESVIEQIDEDYCDEYKNENLYCESLLDNLTSKQIDELQELLDNTLEFFFKAHEIEFEEGDSYLIASFNEEEIKGVKFAQWVSRNSKSTDEFMLWMNGDINQIN